MKLRAAAAIATLLLGFMAASCSGETGDIEAELTPNMLGDVGVCTGVVNDRCPQDMQVIPSDSPRIYVAGRVRNATIGTQVSAVLTNLEGEEPADLAGSRITIDMVNTDMESFPVFYFTNTEPWTRGRYSVKMKVEAEGAEPVYKEFRIE
jgi:hypothetical protein